VPRCQADPGRERVLGRGGRRDRLQGLRPSRDRRGDPSQPRWSSWPRRPARAGPHPRTC
jgi:hypothetical protein